MTEEKPLTRDDVERLIKENGGKAEGLDLSGRNLRQVDLSRSDLRGVILKGADLWCANLEGARLGEANLQGADATGANLRQAHLGCANLQAACLFRADLKGASLGGANLQGAYLMLANLEGAGLIIANLQGAGLGGADLRGASLPGVQLQEAQLEGIHWGRRRILLGPEYLVREEVEAKKEKARQRAHVSWGIAESTYRYLKKCHSEQGMYDVAGDFFFREMTAKRKQMKRWSLSRAWSKLVSLICGYGEIPERTVAWGACWLVGLALLYWLLGAVWPFTLTLEGFLASLYYSAVSFTSLGYGPWFEKTYVQGWAQGVGAFESIMGAFTIALFLVTFTRKMTR